MKLKLVGEGYRSRYLADETGEPIDSMPDSAMKQIVKQNNAHDGLVAALRKIDTIFLTVADAQAALVQMETIARKALAAAAPDA